MDGLVQQGYLHSARTGEGQKKLEPFCEICHGQWTPTGIELMEQERERE